MKRLIDTPAWGGTAGFAALVVLAFVLPDWALFLGTMALAQGLVVLGIVVLMRGGLVSFGHGLYYCLGAYAAGLMGRYLATSDVFVMMLCGGLLSGAFGLLIGPLLVRYRGIFFAVFSLALSMVLYGAIVKMQWIGGTDGMNLAAATFLGYDPEGKPLHFALFLVASGAVALFGMLCAYYFRSDLGLTTLAIKNNELRVEYLGASVHRVSYINYVISAVLAGIGGALAALTLGHIDPELAYWTTSGEFVFVAVLSGHTFVPAVFVSAVALELVRSFSNQYFPNTWQLALGIFLLAVILFVPNGIGSLVTRRRRRPAREAAEP